VSKCTVYYSTQSEKGVNGGQNDDEWFQLTLWWWNK